MNRRLMLASAGLFAVPALGSARTPHNGHGSGEKLAQAAPTPQTTSLQPASLNGGLRASKVNGSTVYNQANDNIGKVDDIIIPRGNGPAAAVLSVGGFLGMGTHYVAVPLSQLQHDQQHNHWVLPNATKEYLKTLPPFSYENAHLQG